MQSARTISLIMILFELRLFELCGERGGSVVECRTPEREQCLL